MYNKNRGFSLLELMLVLGIAMSMTIVMLMTMSSQITNMDDFFKSLVVVQTNVKEKFKEETSYSNLKNMNTRKAFNLTNNTTLEPSSNGPAYTMGSSFTLTLHGWGTVGCKQAIHDLSDKFYSIKVNGTSPYDGVCDKRYNDIELISI